MDKIVYIYIAFFIHCFISSCHGYIRVCYYTNWAQYRKGIARFVPENIDPELCTHLIYAFAKLDGNKLAAVEWNDDSTAWSKGMYEKFNDLKIQNPSLKTLLAVGGWNFGSKKFSDMAASKDSRTVFINSVIPFLRKRKFDGIDLDWEYPAARGGPPQDRTNLANLVKEMRKAFKTESQSSGKAELLLTMAVPADEEKINKGYDVPSIASSVDFLNLMTYDFHGAWDPATGHNSPLYAQSTDFSYGAQKNVKWVADFWLRKGTPRAKMVIGFPLFGRGFTLRDRNNHEIGAEAVAGSHAGPFTKEIGYISYFEVCKMIADGAKLYRDSEQKVPYLVKGDQWIGYDDQESFTEKATWVKQNKFAGVMVWSLALDDFSGQACKTGEKFPMMSTIKRVLEQKEQSTTTTEEVTSEPLTSTTAFPVLVPTDKPDRSVKSNSQNALKLSVEQTIDMETTTTTTTTDSTTLTSTITKTMASSTNPKNEPATTTEKVLELKWGSSVLNVDKNEKVRTNDIKLKTTGSTTTSVIDDVKGKMTFPDQKMLVSKANITSELTFDNNTPLVKDRQYEKENTSINVSHDNTTTDENITIDNETATSSTQTEMTLSPVEDDDIRNTSFNNEGNITSLAAVNVSTDDLNKQSKLNSTQVSNHTRKNDVSTNRSKDSNSSVADTRPTIQMEKVRLLKSKREKKRRKESKKNRKQKSERKSSDKTRTADRIKRSDLSDYSTNFRSRSLLQASGNVNPRSRSVLNSLLEVVSAFASGRNNQQPQDTNERRRQNVDSGRNGQQVNRQQSSNPAGLRRQNDGVRRVAVTPIPGSNDRPRSIGRMSAEERERLILTGALSQQNTGVDPAPSNRRGTQSRTPVLNRRQNRNGNSLQRFGNAQSASSGTDEFVSFNNGRAQPSRGLVGSQANQSPIIPTNDPNQQNLIQQRSRGNDISALGRRNTRRFSQEQVPNLQRGQNIPMRSQTQFRRVNENESNQINRIGNVVSSARGRGMVQTSQISQNSRRPININQPTQSLVNRVSDIQNTQSQNELNTGRLRTALRQGSSRAGEDRNLSPASNVRNSNRIGTTIQPLVLRDRSNINSLIPRRIPLSGVDLDVTDLTRQQPSPRLNLQQTQNSQNMLRNRLANAAVGPTFQSMQEPPEQSLSGNSIRGNELTMLPINSNSMAQTIPQPNMNNILSNTVQSLNVPPGTADRQPERNLAVQPNVNAQRIPNNNLLSLQRNLQLQQSGNTIDTNQIPKPVSQNNDISMITNRILNSFPQNQLRNNMAGHLNLNSPTADLSRNNNNIMNTLGTLRTGPPNQVSPSNNLINRIPSDMRLLAIPSVLQQAQNNRMPPEISSQLDSLRLDDLKLTPGSLQQNVNSVLGQLKDFQSNTIPSAPNSDASILPTNTNTMNIGFPKETVLITTTRAPPIPKPKSKGVIGLLRERFPQLSGEQLTALTAEIQRQVDIVKAQLREQRKGTTASPQSQDTASTKPKRKPKAIIQLNDLLKNVAGVSKKNKISPIPDIEKFQIKAPATVEQQAVEATAENVSSKQIDGLQLLSKQMGSTQKNQQNMVDMDKIRRELIRSGLPSNLVIQINPMPLLGQRTHSGIAPTAEALGIANIAPTNQPSSLDRQQVRRMILENRSRGLSLPKVPLDALPQVPTEQPMSDAIQSPHELADQGQIAPEMALLPSTPATSPRQQLIPSNETVVLRSRENSNIPLPKSEVLWKWQL